MQASAALNVSAIPETGPWLITLDEPSYIAVLTFSANRHAHPPACLSHIAWQAACVASVFVACPSHA